MSCIPGETYKYLYEAPLCMPFNVQDRTSYYSKHQRILIEVDNINQKQDPKPTEKRPVEMEYKEWRKAVLIVSTISIMIELIIGTVSIVEGVKSDSSGTLGFGLETMTDVVTTAVIIWRFYGNDEASKREFKSVLVLAILLMLIAIGTAVGATYNLLQEFKPFKEYLLMIICCVGFGVFTLLGWLKVYLGERIRSKAVVIDGISTICAACTAVALLASLIVYKLTNIWFLDGVVALLVALIMAIYSSRVLYKDVYLVYKSETQYTSLEDVKDETIIDDDGKHGDNENMTLKSVEMDIK